MGFSELGACSRLMCPGPVISEQRRGHKVQEQGDISKSEWVEHLVRVSIGFMMTDIHPDSFPTEVMRLFMGSSRKFHLHLF